MARPMKFDREAGTLKCKVCGAVRFAAFQDKTNKSGQPVLARGLQVCPNAECETNQLVDGKKVGYYPRQKPAQAGIDTTAEAQVA